MSTAVPAIEAPQLKWTSDAEAGAGASGNDQHAWRKAVRLIQCEVSEALFSILHDQLTKLDQLVDEDQPGKVRYQQARAAGCLAAVAKGVKDRELIPTCIFIPGTEVHTLKNGKLRISALKATLPLPIPKGVQVKGVTFEADESEKWQAILEVVDVEAEA